MFILSENDVQILRDIKEWYNRNKNSFINQFRRNPRLLGGGGGLSVSWVKIIQMPSYPDPAADDSTPEYAGRAYYICRLLSSDYDPWTASQPYLTDAYATYSDDLYKAKRNNTNARPDISPDDWELVEEIKIEYAIGSENIPAKINNCVPWIQSGEIVPIISRTIEGIGTRYFIWQTLINTGTPEQATLRYNPDEKITQAVFR